MARLIAIAFMSFIASNAVAQVKLEADPQPKVVNAQLETRAAGDLMATVDQLARSAQPLWIGYAVPMLPKSHFICCFEGSVSNWKRIGCCSGCKLERPSGNIFHSDGGSCVPREPATTAVILLRLSGGRATRIRAFTPDCGLDAGGLRLVWLTGVAQSQSLALLKGYISTGEKKLAQDAIQAIALHQDPAADKLLESLLAGGNPEWLREDAAFWLGSQRGRDGFLALQNAARADPDDNFREHLTFVMSESREPEAVPELIRMAKQDRSAKVRGQALFWMAQKASHQAEAAITDAIENDPDREIKQKAVFALSEMPPEQGVPLLIKYAKGHKDPKVRKEAIFWLGESEDPRALAFLEELLVAKN